MKLRRVQIIGFKSFRKRTGVEVGDGITAVVGPNGCGKSNIVDAVRWAMGSQSPKDLRGRAMEDVIFAGSSTSRPGGFAEVTLTFDNDVEHSQLPLEYRDSPTIEITRRLYRTGESDYEINKSSARLRDIQAVFAGTGVGARDAYSIIEQGRIGFVVSARPEERRVIIEEAAGITRYKRQRKTAERRLEKTRDNLLRVRDVLGEVRRQLGRLEREAAKAAKHRTLSDELRGFELKIAVERHRAANDKVLQQVAAQAAAAKIAEDAAIALHSVEARVEAARASLVSVEERASEKSEEAYKTRARVELLKNTVRHLETKREELAETIASLQQTATSEGDRRVEHEQELEAAQTALAGERRALEELQVELRAASEQSDSAREGYRARREEAEALRQQLHRVEREHNLARARIESLQAEQDRAASRRSEFEDEVNAARKAYETLEQDVSTQETATRAAQRAYDEVVAETEKIQTREKELREQLEDDRRALRAAEQEHASHASKAEALRLSIQQGDSLAPVLRKIQRAAEQGSLPGVLGPLAARFEMDETAARQVSSILGDAFEGVLAEDAAAARAIVSWARQHGESVVVLTMSRDSQGALFDGCFATQNIPGWVFDRLQSYERTEDLTTSPAEGRWVDEHRSARDELGVYRVRSSGSASEKLLRQKSELRALDERLESLGASRDALEARVAGRSDRLESTLRERIASQELAEEKLRERRRATGLLDELSASRRRARAAWERAEKDLESTTARASSMGEEIAGLQTTLSQTLEQRRELATALDQASAEVEAQNAAREAAESRLADVRVRDAQLRERVRSSESDVRRAQRELLTAGERAEQARRAIAESRERRLHAEVEQTEREEELGRVKRHLETAERLAEEARERLDRASQSLRDLEVAQAEARRDASDAERDKADADLALERARGELERAVEAIVERFRLSVDEAEAVAARVPDCDDLQERVRGLRTQIERIGVVNPAAEEAFEEAREREEYLSAQKADLEEAMEDIELAIRKMDKTSRKLFAETFEAVNEGFRRMFPRLFSGGRGRLELTDPNDLLSTGIEIIVQPPGKRVQNMSLLSGGEKALTAVALIFSIFQLKPTPFCILDEVDAPLDEANVGRFSDMVREISQRSQFLIITHNTRTMEAADTLYGVTMEVPGESKLVGVRLRGQTVQIEGEGTELDMNANR